MFKYEDVKPIRPYVRTVWLIHDKTNGVKLLEVWHETAKIEDVINAYRVMHPGNLFVVYTMDVGSFELGKIITSVHNARGVDQDMNICVE